MARGRGSTVSSLVVRTVSFDKLLLERLAEGGIDTVLNLAAGLDTRPYRLPLPASLRWIEIDLPALVTYKNERLVGESPRCLVERIGLDLADADARRAQLTALMAPSRGTLVVTEGLILYLDAPLVTALAQDLAALPACQSWLLDLLHPDLLPFVVQSWSKGVTGDTAPKFAPPGGATFFEPLGWTQHSSLSAWEEGARLDRPIGPPASALQPAQVEAFRTMNTYLRLDRRDG